MNHWQATFLGLKQLPRELSGFAIEAFFTFTASERALIEARRGPSLKLGLALQIGFLRMSGRVLDAVRIVPPALWKHLGSQFGEQAPDLASLRAMYRRHRTLFDHQELACEALGFHPLIEAFDAKVRFSWLMLGREPRSVSAIEGTQRSPSVSTTRLRGTRDTEADMRGELGFQPGTTVLGPMGPFARFGPKRTHECHQRPRALWLRSSR
jgi:hypothetical protein